MNTHIDFLRVWFFPETAGVFLVWIIQMQYGNTYVTGKVLLRVWKHAHQEGQSQVCKIN